MNWKVSQETWAQSFLCLHCLMRGESFVWWELNWSWQKKSISQQWLRVSKKNWNCMILPKTRSRLAICLLEKGIKKTGIFCCIILIRSFDMGMSRRISSFTPTRPSCKFFGAYIRLSCTSSRFKCAQKRSSNKPSFFKRIFHEWWLSPFGIDKSSSYRCRPFKELLPDLIFSLTSQVEKVWKMKLQNLEWVPAKLQKLCWLMLTALLKIVPNICSFSFVFNKLWFTAKGELCRWLKMDVDGNAAAA